MRFKSYPRSEERLKRQAQCWEQVGKDGEDICQNEVSEWTSLACADAFILIRIQSWDVSLLILCWGKPEPWKKPSSSEHWRKRDGFPELPGHVLGEIRCRRKKLVPTQMSSPFSNRRKNLEGEAQKKKCWDVEKPGAVGDIPKGSCKNGKSYKESEPQQLWRMTCYATS